MPAVVMTEATPSIFASCVSSFATPRSVVASGVPTVYETVPLSMPVSEDGMNSEPMKPSGTSAIEPIDERDSIPRRSPTIATQRPR